MFQGLDDGPLLPRMRKINASEDEVFSVVDQRETRRARAWLKDRISRAAKLPENELYHEAVEITPAMAEILLAKHNKGNRLPVRRRVSLYADAIRRGEWLFHSQGISLARDGTLNNGQHRLRAIIEAGTPTRMNVTFNEDRNAFMALDTGKARGGKDTLTIATNHKYTACLAAAARLLKNIKFGGRGKISATNIEIVEIVNDNPDLAEWSCAATKISCSIKGAGAAGPNVAFYLIDQQSKRPEHLPEFAERLADGADLSKTNPILILREALIKKEIGKGKARDAASTHVAAAIINAWNQWLSGKRGVFSKIVWQDGEPFPKAE